MKNPTPQKIYLKDYQAPPYKVEKISLNFNLFEEVTTVTSRMQVSGDGASPLLLDGEDLKLISIKINGMPLGKPDYALTPTGLAIKNLSSRFDLEIVTEIYPQKNTSLSGLYKSGGGFCTQNEAEGFRRITFFTDRPDVMAKYEVTIEADEKKYPILLSNGNLVSKKSLNNGRHQAVWHDPFPKPCYLFALVAGDYGCIRDEFTTQSGRKVLTEIYCNHGNEDRCHHAMESLKKSMKWDEEKYGREYDLDRYMILAVDDFNAGAMENKGLNIFNSRLVLANPASATDTDYESIEAVVAHEYFHNWTGNRITLRDWFHLSLKEGLTVFRDQQFTADQTSEAIKRIDDVQRLRSSQFTEDGGPNAHPVRPESCYAVDNFYTSTIYEKGAEVIRMLEVLVGPMGFRKAMDHYFATYDGQAVIIEDFVKSFEITHNLDLTQFKLWYSQAGTPRLKISESFDANKQIFSLEITQSCPPTPHQNEKQPFHIPIKFGLLNQKGDEIRSGVLELKKTTQTYQFDGVTVKPIASLLRNFSSPVEVDWNISQSELLHLAKYDSDGFNRWEALQTIYRREIEVAYEQEKVSAPYSAPTDLLNSLSDILNSGIKDPALTEKLFSLPSSSYLIQNLTNFDPQHLSSAYKRIETAIATHLESQFLDIYTQLQDTPSEDTSFRAASRRGLRNTCLYYLGSLSVGPGLAYRQFLDAKNMTESFGALIALNQNVSNERTQASESFFSRWKNDGVVLNKWFGWVAMYENDSTLLEIQRLVTSTYFKRTNPNNNYYLLGRFGKNLVAFHQANGSAYEFFADQIIATDKLNPQVGARLSDAFDSWKRLESSRKAAAEKALKRILATEGLSPNTFELIKNMVEN